MARLTQIIANFFGGELSIGIDTIDHLDTDNGDNGTYIIDTDAWEIIDRKFMNYPEQTEYDIDEFLHDIDNKQPEEDRIYKDESN